MVTTESTDKTTPRANPLKVHFFVESVNKIAPPEGMTGDDWHSYTIGYGASKIEGKKPGSLQSVTQHANTVVEDLNARADIKNNSTYAANKKTTARTAARTTGKVTEKETEKETDKATDKTTGKESTSAT